MGLGVKVGVGVGGSGLEVGSQVFHQAKISISVLTMTEFSRMDAASPSDGWGLNLCDGIREPLHHGAEPPPWSRASTMGATLPG